MGYHFYFQLRLAEVKLEMKNETLQIAEEDQTLLSFTDAEMQLLNWENNAEFEYRDKMYDVIRIERKQGQNIINCVADKKETALLAKYMETQQQSSEKNSSRQILKLLTTQYLASSEVFLSIAGENKQKQFASYLLRFSSSKPDAIVPPPKVC